MSLPSNATSSLGPAASQASVETATTASELYNPVPEDKTPWFIDVLAKRDALRDGVIKRLGTVGFLYMLSLELKALDDESSDWDGIVRTGTADQFGYYIAKTMQTGTSMLDSIRAAQDRAHTTKVQEVEKANERLREKEATLETEKRKLEENQISLQKLWAEEKEGLKSEIASLMGKNDQIAERLRKRLREDEDLLATFGASPSS